MKKLVFTFIVILSIGISYLAFTACTSSEPSPEVVDDSFNDEVYFVSGRVTHNQLMLEGVTVHVEGTDQSVSTTSAGTYQLFFTGKGTYVLRFHKEGFVDIVTSVLFDDASPNRSSIVVSPDMTKSGTEVVVSPDDEIEIADITGRAVLSLMRSVAEKTNVALTVYKDLPVIYTSGNTLKSQPYGVGYTTVAIEPSGVTLAKESTLRVNKQTSDAVSFATVGLYKLNRENKWEKANDVVLDKTRNAYTTTLTSFSSYSLRIPYSVSGSQEAVSDHLNGKLTIDNCGNMSARENLEIAVNQLCGWDFVTDLHQEIRSMFPGISQPDEEALYSIITEQITSLEGSSAGYYELPVVLSTASVSGNSVLHYENYAKESTVTYSFDMDYLDNPYTLSATIKKYTGMEEKYTNKSCYQHSGGQGQ